MEKIEKLLLVSMERLLLVVCSQSLLLEYKLTLFMPVFYNCFCLVLNFPKFHRELEKIKEVLVI